MSLFEFESKKIELSDGWIIYDECFIPSKEAKSLFDFCLSNLKWEESEIVLFGKRHKTPRLEAYYAENKVGYGYAGKRLTIHDFIPQLLNVKRQVEKTKGSDFNAVLANLYRDGSDSNGWHADNEPELGRAPEIASVSLGATRNFHLKHNKTKEKLTFELKSGSLLIMGGDIQQHWKHQIPKTKKQVSPRINLTFRKIVS